MMTAVPSGKSPSTTSVNHWNFVLWPQRDGELTGFLRWLTHTHTMRWHAHYHTSGTGHLYQDRFKSFPIKADEHLYAVLRYVERNALRANLVQRGGIGAGRACGGGSAATAPTRQFCRPGRCLNRRGERAMSTRRRRRWNWPPCGFRWFGVIRALVSCLGSEGASRILRLRLV